MDRQALNRLALIVPVLWLLAACGGAQTTTGVTEDAALDVTDGNLHVLFLDVGQGDSIVIVTPEGRVVLLDAGPPDTGPSVVAELQEIGVWRINLALISHAHADHIGGYQDVLGEFPVLRYGDPGYPHTSIMYANLLERLFDLGVDAYQLSMGQLIRLDDDVQMRVLVPPDPLISGSRSDANANSLIVLVTYNDVSLLLMGDAEEDTERVLFASGGLTDVDVLKVAHHGSAYATTERFLQTTRPEIAVISCGAGNSYGHPSPETLSRLATVATEGIYRTDLDGTIVVTTDGESIVVRTHLGVPQVLRELVDPARVAASF